MEFEAEVLLAGKTATGISVPEAVVERLGGGRRVKVTATINGYSYRSSIAPYNGRFMLPLSAEHRAAAGVEAGERITVEVELDAAPRSVTLPPDFAEALDADPVAKEYFDGLSFTNQNVHVSAVESAKKPETRARRIAKSVATLHARKPR